MAISLYRKPLLSSRLARPSKLAKVVSRVPVVCQAQSDENIRSSVAMPIASLVAAMMLAGSLVPEEALAARSSGRAGGSSFSARRSAPAPSARASPVMRSTTVVVAPSVYAPPIFSPFGFGGFGYGGFMPFPIFGSLFQFMFLALVVSVVFNVIRGFGAGNKSSGEKKDDGWGDL